jgi:hypothetical protein
MQLKDIHPELTIFFSLDKIFLKLQRLRNSVERRKLSYFVLNSALVREFDFVIEDLLDGREAVTEQTIKLLIEED